MMGGGKVRRSVAACQRGMTLLEIMIALLILGTVLTMVSLSLSGSVNVLNATRDHGEIYHRAQVALLRISEDLASAILVEDVDFIGTDGQEDGQDADTLRFSSTAHLVFNRDMDKPGVAVITYSVKDDPEREGELILFRSDELLAGITDKDDPGDQDGGFALCDRLRSVNFKYLGADGEEQEEWSTKLDPGGNPDDRKLPVAVQCTLEFWVDRERETSIELSTGVLLPAGLINAQNTQGN